MNLKIDKRLFIQINVIFTIIILIGFFVYLNKDSLLSNNVLIEKNYSPNKYSLLDTTSTSSTSSTSTSEPPLYQHSNSTKVYKEDVNLRTIEKEIKTHSEFLFVNSKYYNESEGTITLKDLSFKNVIGFELYSYSFPKSTYVINNQNNQFVFKDATDSYLIDINIGDYDALTICTELQDKIRTVVGNSINVTYISSLAGINFSNSDAFTLEFSKLLLQFNLGFKENLNRSTLIDGSHVIRSTGRIDLFNNRYVKIRAPQLKQFYGNTDIVALVNTENPINYNMYDQQQRQFLIACDYLKQLVLYLETVNPYSESINFESNNLGFHLCFVVKSLVEVPKNLLTKKLYF